MKNDNLEYGEFYHIYNHAVGNRDLFKCQENYEYFLSLYDKYISPIAETFAWVLMPNHFHFLVKIKEKSNILDSDLTGFENLSGLKPLHQYFSNLFNAYTKAYNIFHETSGTLFERPFKRKLIDNKNYLKKVVLYIHNNPVHHHFCEHAMEYPWSSYLTCVSEKSTKLKRNEIINWFNDANNFKSKHNEKIDFADFDDWLDIF